MHKRKRKNKNKTEKKTHKLYYTMRPVVAIKLVTCIAYSSKQTTCTYIICPNWQQVKQKEQQRRGFESLRDRWPATFRQRGVFRNLVILERAPPWKSERQDWCYEQTQLAALLFEKHAVGARTSLEEYSFDQFGNHASYLASRLHCNESNLVGAWISVYTMHTYWVG